MLKNCIFVFIIKGQIANQTISLFSLLYVQRNILGLCVECTFFGNSTFALVAKFNLVDHRCLTEFNDKMISTDSIKKNGRINTEEKLK